MLQSPLVHAVLLRFAKSISLKKPRTMNEVTRLLHDLVRLPSVNPMGRSLPAEITYEHRVTAYVEDFFRRLGVRHERQTIAPQRDNIIGYTDLPAPRRTLLLEAHQDTVPADNMTIDPFGAAIDQGRLYGRGACDIKGGMAAMLAVFARIVREKPAGAANLVMACSVDEEHTFLGVQRLVQKPMAADMAVVAEPTQLQIVNAHKGVCRWYVTTSGRACHSSRPEQGINAIYRMGSLLSAIERYAEALRLAKVDPLLGPATLSVGRIEGGTSANTVPDCCQIEVDRRLVSGEDPLQAPRELFEYLRQFEPTPGSFSCSEPWLHCPALRPEKAGEIVARLGAAIDAVKGTHQVTAVPYGTDASSIAEAGIPAVVFGPGDIARAHTVDEWVPLDEVEAASEILYRLACSG